VALPLESVPNFSEGRDAETVKAIGRALAEHAELLDVHVDVDHNRSVFTLVGGDDEVETIVGAAFGQIETDAGRGARDDGDGVRQ